MRTRVAVVAVAATLVLSACTAEPEPEEPVVTTSAEAGSEPAAETTESPEPEPSDPLADAAAAIGCAGWEQSAEPAPFVDAWGTCDLDGSAVQLYLIPDDAAYASFVESVAGFGITEAQMVRSGPIVAAPSDQTQLDAIRSALG